MHTSSEAVMSTICVCPELSSWVAAELAKESSVLKEHRKAREQRALANKPGGK